MARAETVREPCVCWKRVDEADGSCEEDVDNDEDDDENDDVDCDDCECGFCGWGMPLEAMVVAVVPFPVIFILKARKISAWMGAKVDLRRMREASRRRAKLLREYSMVAHGL